MSSSKIKFFFIDVTVSLRKRTELKAFISGIFKKEGVKLSDLNYIFCTDNYLLKINARYLGHNYFTDTVTFDLSETNKVSGEVYISIDRVRANSREFHSPFSTELIRVMFHGALHLCGYNDKSKLEISLMRKKEDKLIQAWFVSRET